MDRFIYTISLLLLITANYAQEVRTQKHAENHFDAKGNEPSEYTIKKWEDLKNTMPFEDKQDFEEQKKGLLPHQNIDKLELMQGMLLGIWVVLTFC